jgi:hypothetical protein
MAELTHAAENRGVRTYQDIAVIMGLPFRCSHMGAEVGNNLCEISEDEVKVGRPMLSAVAVGVNGKPGSCFFSLAKELGRLNEGNDPNVFWEKERDVTYDTWWRPLPE